MGEKKEKEVHGQLGRRNTGSGKGRGSGLWLGAVRAARLAGAQLTFAQKQSGVCVCVCEMSGLLKVVKIVMLALKQ